MGLFKNLFGKGKDGATESKGYQEKEGPFSRDYWEIREWVESSIGPMHPDDPNLIPNIKKLVAEEKRRWGGSDAKLRFNYEGGNTYITGETMKMRRQLKSIGCVWDKKRRAWVAMGRKLGETDIPESRKCAGLEAYCNKVEYRIRMGS